MGIEAKEDEEDGSAEVKGITTFNEAGLVGIQPDLSSSSLSSTAVVSGAAASAQGVASFEDSRRTEGTRGRANPDGGLGSRAPLHATGGWQRKGRWGNVLVRDPGGEGGPRPQGPRTKAARLEPHVRSDGGGAVTR